MRTRLTSILFCIILLTLFATHSIPTTQRLKPSHNNKVLAAKTERVISQPSPRFLQQTVKLSDRSSYILHDVNQYRTSLGLYPVQSSPQTCAYAKIRAKEITQHFTHDEFYRRVNNHTIPYSHWTRAVENIAETPDFKEVVTLWKNSPDHALNMRDKTPYVCVVQDGNYFAY